MATASEFIITEDSIRLARDVTRAFNITADKLELRRSEISSARTAAYVTAGGGVVLSGLAAVATGGLSVLFGGAAISAILLAIFIFLSRIAKDILDSSDVNDLEENWKALKREFLADRNVPTYNKEAIERWARQNLDRKGADAVINALKKSTSESRSTTRLENLKSNETETLLESLLNLVLADFSVFEILVGAMERKEGDSGNAIRSLADELDSHRQKLERELEERKKQEKRDRKERERREREEKERKKREEKEKRERQELERREREEKERRECEEKEKREREEKERREREEREHPQTLIHEIKIAIGPIPTNTPEQSAHTPSKGSGLDGSLQQALQKDSNINPRNIRESYSASRYTQTPGDPDKRSLPKPIFCRDWEKETHFDQAGGILQKPKSEVLLNVPRGALDVDANIYMSICTDVARIHKVLKKKDVYVAGPVAEFWTKAKFQKPVQICLPHCLSLPGEIQCLTVFRISRKDDGDIDIQRLEESRPAPADAGQDDTTHSSRPHFPEGTFHISSDDEQKVYIKTTCFSAYVVVQCPFHKEENCELRVMGCGWNKYSEQSRCSNGFIQICVWDKRLEIEDWRPEDAVTKAYRLELPASFNNRTKDPHLSMKLSIDSTEPAWVYCGNSEGPLQAEVQKLRLKAKQCCGDGSVFLKCRHQCEKAQECPIRKDFRKDDTVCWQLKTVQSAVPPWLRCTVKIAYVDDSLGSQENDVKLSANLEPVVEKAREFKSRHLYSGLGGAAAYLSGSGARPKENRHRARQAGSPSEQQGLAELWDRSPSQSLEDDSFLDACNFSISQSTSASRDNRPT